MCGMRTFRVQRNERNRFIQERLRVVSKYWEAGFIKLTVKTAGEGQRGLEVILTSAIAMGLRKKFAEQISV